MNIEFKLQLVERVFEDGSQCDDCRFLYRWVERHPYGSTYAEEPWAECRVPEKEPDLCQGLHKEEQKFARQLSDSIAEEMELP